ncbi:MAG: hypothetical protein ACOX8W_07760 [bacterium]|jgi:hypothetical protein
MAVGGEDLPKGKALNIADGQEKGNSLRADEAIMNRAGKAKRRKSKKRRGNRKKMLYSLPVTGYNEFKPNR